MTFHSEAPTPVDGRRARSQRTREAVAQATLDLIEEGNLRPTAAQVAVRAGVSERAVFRHFEAREALFQAAANLHVIRVLSQLPPPVTSGTFEERLQGLLRRASAHFEQMGRIRTATRLYEPFSPAIQQRLAWGRRMARRELEEVFEPELSTVSAAERRELTTALLAVVNWETWNELRVSGGVSTARASRILARMLRTLIEGWPDSGRVR